MPCRSGTNVERRSGRRVEPDAQPRVVRVGRGVADVRRKVEPWVTRQGACIIAGACLTAAADLALGAVTKMPLRAAQGVRGRGRHCLALPTRRCVPAGRARCAHDSARAQQPPPKPRRTGASLAAAASPAASPSPAASNRPPSPAASPAARRRAQPLPPRPQPTPLPKPQAPPAPTGDQKGSASNPINDGVRAVGRLDRRCWPRANRWPSCCTTPPT